MDRGPGLGIAAADLAVLVLPVADVCVSEWLCVFESGEGSGESMASGMPSEAVTVDEVEVPVVEVPVWAVDVVGVAGEKGAVEEEAAAEGTRAECLECRPLVISISPSSSSSPLPSLSLSVTP
jgi:hypothetical protein